MVVALESKVASREGCKNVGVVDLGLLDITHFGDLGGGDSQMVHSLLKALGFQVGLANGKMCGYQSKIGFSMGEYQNFGKGQLVESDLKSFLSRLEVDIFLDGLHEFLEVLGQRGQYGHTAEFA